MRNDYGCVGNLRRPSVVGMRSPTPISMSRWRLTKLVLTGLLVAGLSGCSVLDRHDGPRAKPVLELVPGDCVVPPAAVKAQLSEVDVVDCSDPHPMEAYAVVRYKARDGSVPAVFPGVDAMKAFADGACLERFDDYVGVDYRDSHYYFTYLMPTARDWDGGAGDVSVTCLVMTTGEQWRASVRHVSP